MRGKWLLRLALLVAAAVVIALYLEFNVFIVKTVAVDGAEDRDYIVKLAKIDFGARTRSVDLEAIAVNINSSGAYECLSVERGYPGSINIVVRARVGVVVTQCGGAYVTLDGGGCVMREDRSAPDMTGLIYVSGIEARAYSLGSKLNCDERRLSAACATAESIFRNGAESYVSELNAADPDALFLYSRTGLRVKLGDGENMDQKLILMKYTIIDLEARGEARGTLDVTNGSSADFSPN